MAKGHFAFIPEETLLSQHYKSLCVHAKALYPYMVARRAGVDLPFTYTYQEIKQDTGFRNDMISKSITELEKEGFLEYEHGGLEGNRNLYHLVDSWLHLAETVQHPIIGRPRSGKV